MNKHNTSMLTEPIVKFFRGKNFGFLGTVNKDGSPQVTPTWIDIIEKEENNKTILVAAAKTGMIFYDYSKKKIAAVPEEVKKKVE